MASLPPIDLPSHATGEGAFDAPPVSGESLVLFDYLLRLGDDSLILGQRLGEHCGHAPSVEVDLSLANMALARSGGGVEGALPAGIARKVDRGQRGHQMCFTSSGMS